MKKILAYVKELPLEKELLDKSKTEAENNFKTVVDARKNFEQEMEAFNLIDKYWNRVYRRRLSFSVSLLFKSALFSIGIRM